MTEEKLLFCFLMSEPGLMIPPRDKDLVYSVDDKGWQNPW